MLEIKKSEYRENVEAFAIAVVTILFILIFIAQSFLVKGTSMDPTLQDGERLIVNKFTYKFRTPKTGEVIVFKYPGDPTKKFIKRVIGEPGDSVSIQDSKVYVNGRALDEPYILEKMDSDYDYVTVPEGTIFVLGDNRNGSRDSRYSDVGFVPLKNVVGRANFIFWPINKIKILFNPHNKDKLPISPIIRLSKKSNFNLEDQKPELLGFLFSCAPVNFPIISWLSSLYSF